MFTNILVPADLSKKNERALKIAVGLAELGRGRIHLLHVIQTLADTSFDEMENFYLRLQERAYQDMETLADAHAGSPVPIDQKVVYGNRTQEILRYAEETGIDLIVMNSHRIKPDDPSQGWGTISYKVGILAGCPVMLVK